MTCCWYTNDIWRFSVVRLSDQVALVDHIITSLKCELQSGPLLFYQILFHLYFSLFQQYPLLFVNTKELLWTLILIIKLTAGANFSERYKSYSNITINSSKPLCHSWGRVTLRFFSCFACQWKTNCALIFVYRSFPDKLASALLSVVGAEAITNRGSTRVPSRSSFLAFLHSRYNLDDSLFLFL